jgi:hypothetical protein
MAIVAAVLAAFSLLARVMVAIPIAVGLVDLGG